MPVLLRKDAALATPRGHRPRCVAKAASRRPPRSIQGAFGELRRLLTDSDANEI
jgi:hypothetical protein